MNLRTQLKSGYTWEYDDEEKILRVGTPSDIKVFIPRVKARSLLCFLNRIAWHRDIKRKKS